MTERDPHWLALQRLFRAALELPEDEREAFLRASCDDESRAAVEDLLCAHAQSEAYLEAPLVAEAQTPECTDLPRIEGFEILREIGRGGMGVVFEARQQRPHRTVALKVLRSNVMSRELMRRFEHEAHLLGRLQHAGIAQVYGAGTSGSAQDEVPYFAMELVRGLALDDFVEQRGLGVRERLELLAKIADAVHHAHTKGVIHRDLKPANILVTPEGQPKILDFGVARATDVDVQLTTLRTDVGQLIGTLPYMSPEQTAGDPDAVDSRSDVYALGVIGFELLAGELPYPVRGKLLHEAVRVIQEEEPTRLSALDRRYRGDVETILAKALEKEAERRYAGASDLAADLRRHLDDEPIVARPASRVYQLAKFAKRNRALVSAAALLAFVLVAASAVSTTLAMQRASALRSATDARTAAERRERVALEVRRFLEEDVLAQANPNVNRDRGLTVAEALENAAERLDGKFRDEPEVEYSLRATLGSTLSRLSRTDEALAQSERALELAEAIHGPASGEARSARLAVLLVQLAQGSYREVAVRLEALLEQAQGNGAEDVLLRLRSLVALGQAHHNMSATAEATETLERAWKLAQTAADYPRRESWHLQGMLAGAWKEQGRYREAEALIRKLLREQGDVVGADDPEAINTANTLAIVLMESAELDEAEAVSRDVVDRATRVLGPEHNNTLSAQTLLATVLRKQGRFDEALALHRTKLEIQKRTQGETFVETLTTQQSIASILQRQGKLDEAEELARATLSAQLETLGEKSYFTMHTVGTLASIHQSRGELDEAEEMMKAALGIATDLYGRDNTQTASWIHNLGTLYETAGRLTEAAELYSEAADINASVFHPLHLNVLISKISLADVTARLDQPGEAARLYAEAIDGFVDAGRSDHWTRANGMVKYGRLLHRLGRREESLQVAREGAAILEATFGTEHAHARAARAEVLRLESRAER